MRGGREAIIITELPYQVNKASLIEKIAELKSDKKLDGISEIRDESNREGIRVVLELARGEIPQIVMNQLYKHTQMQTTFGIIMLALVDRRPQIVTLKEMLEAFVRFRREIVTRRTRFDLARAEERAPILPPRPPSGRRVGSTPSARRPPRGSAPPPPAPPAPAPAARCSRHPPPPPACPGPARPTRAKRAAGRGPG